MSPRLAIAGLLSITLLLANGCLRAPAPTAVSGILHGEVTWDGVVHLGGDVLLAPDARVTIRPGTQVLFLPPQGYPGGLVEHPHFAGSELIVQGELRAEGTAAAPIVFRSADRQAPPGSWGAVNFEGGTGLFAFCVFRQADSAIHSRESRVTVTESLFEDNLVGLRFHSSAIVAEHNLWRRNGAAIRFHFGDPVIRSNRFEENRTHLFVTASPRNYQFTDNIFGAAEEYQVVLGEDVPDDVVLAGNYWGTAPTGEIVTRIFDGRRAPYLGRVQLEPRRSAPLAGAGPAWIR